MTTSIRIPLLTTVEQRARREIIGRVVSVFNDQSRGERPVTRSDDALFPRDSPIWRVHGDVTSMMVGGVAALLLQMLHPAVLAGVWDHSNFRTDMLGRLRRTARFIALTTYAEKTEAAAAIGHVREIHSRVSGTLPDGAPYRADDPALLAWVHVTEATSFLAAWQRYGRKVLTRSEQDRYFEDFALVARELGASPVPETKTDADKLLAQMRPQLRATARSREVARIVLTQRPPNPLAAPIQTMTFQAAVDLLPDWARHMHGLRARDVARPLVKAGTRALASTLRWAFAG